MSRSGRGAAYKVAMKNARRNKKRTIFLVLLVAVPVAFGVVVAGIVRASTLTPEERAQTYFGSADARIQIYDAGSEEVNEWVFTTIAEAAPESRITGLRQSHLRVEDIGYTQVWDLDMDDPVNSGLLVHVSGDLPDTSGEIAISPALADSLEVEVGDTVELDSDLGELEIVGLVSEPFSTQGSHVLLHPGALASYPGDRVETSFLVSGPGAEEAVTRLNDLWYTEGQQQFWPEPGVDEFPVEIAFLATDDYLARLLTEVDVANLAELARNADLGVDVEGLVYDAANQMVYGDNYVGLPDMYAETRTQWLLQGGFGENPAVLATAAAAIVLVEVAFVTGAAFAAGTRRRLREIGLMGANGASEKHVRSTVVGEGLTIGAVGAGLGVVLGIGVMVVARPLVQRFVSKVITGVGVGFADLVGPVAVALLAVLLAVLIPARTASRVPTTTALQGRMPALAPRKWVVPVGLGMAVVGGLLMSVSLVSMSNIAGVLVGVGAVATVGGVAMLSSPVLAWVAKLSDKVPATSRLVLRDSGRNRTRAAVAVSAIMVILLAPVVAMITSATATEHNMIYGLPEPDNQVLLYGSYQDFGGDFPVSEADIATLAAIVPEEDVAVFDTYDLFATTDALLDARDAGEPANWGYSDGYAVAAANEDLLRVLGDPGVTGSIRNGEIVILGIEDRDTRVEINGVEYPAREYPVRVLRFGMPRVLLPESVVGEFGDPQSRPVALLTLERPLTEDEWSKMWNQNLQINARYPGLDESAIYLLMAGATLLVVLIVVALVTAVSAAEVDQEVRTIVAVGAPGSIRRRFLGLLTGYQTLVALALALPLSLALVWVVSSANDYQYAGPFGVISSSDITVPWLWLGVFAVALPLVIGVLTLISVRSAPVTPPRRAT